MNIVFLGTAAFGLPSLEKLCSSGYSPAAVVTVPDKPAGRGQRIRMSAVKAFALDHSISLFQPARLKDPSFHQALLSLKPDLMIVVAFRILPPEIYLIPARGTFNLHASLLPKYRGAAPINWAIINGERETGVTTFFLDEKVDTGSVILQRSIEIGADETGGEVHDRLAILGADVVLETVRMIEAGRVDASLQNGSEATPAPKIFTEDCKIDWSRPAHEVHNFIRGLSPRPGAFTPRGGKAIKIYRSRHGSPNAIGKPGEVLSADKELLVATGKGSIEVVQLQAEGKQTMSAEDFLRGAHLVKGELLG